MTFLGIFRKDKKEATERPMQIRLKKPDPDYRQKQEDRVYNAIWKTSEFGTDEIQIVLDELKKRQDHEHYRARVAFLAGEIGKELGYGYPNRMAEGLIKYLLCELDGRPETIAVAGKDKMREEVPVKQPHKAALAALVALEKISTNDDLYVSTLVSTDIVPGLKQLHRTTVPELRSCIRQTIMNIKTVCPTNPMDVGVYRTILFLTQEKSEFKKILSKS